MILPIRTDARLRSTPWMNWALIAANVIMFLIQKRIWDENPTIALWPRSPHLLHYFTYAFLHGDLLHLLGNMLFLYIFGNNVNDKMGHAGYLGFYLAGSVAAGISYVLFPGRGGLPVVGASGAVAAVTGAYLVLFPRANVTILYFFFLIGTIQIASIWLILVFFAYDFIYLSGSSGVAHQAHIGGTIFGALICAGLLWVKLLPRDTFDILSLISHVNRRRQYRDQVATGWDPFSAGGGPVAQPGGAFAGFASPRRAQPPPLDPLQSRITDLRASIAEAIAAQDLVRAADLYAELKLVDPQQVLARQAQLDVANQLAGQQRYPLAAEAYETFLRQYPKFEQIEQVELMLGIIYARYLSQYARAKECLVRALARLHNERESAMARAELSRIEPLV